MTTALGKETLHYPRTDSRYLTVDMAGSVPTLAFIASVLCGEKEPETVLAAQICDSGKATDHHAIVPTRTAAQTNLDGLPTGEHEILRLVARPLLRAVCRPYRYAETAVTVDCGGYSFTAKGKEVLDLGWRTYAENKEDTILPDGLTEGAALAVDAVRVKTGLTAPPRHFTEDVSYKG